MPDTLAWLMARYGKHLRRRMPVPIPNVGRDDLARWCAELGFRAIVEVGVRTGKFTEVLCEANPEARVVGVDPWIPYEGYLTGGRHNTKEFMNDEYAQASSRLARYPNCSLIRKFSADAVKDFEPDSIDAVYIDANHTREYLLADLEGWTRIVRPGGIISGHDYKPLRNPHEVIEAYETLNEYTVLHKINPWFVLGSRRSIPGEVRDYSRSWMWVK